MILASSWRRPKHSALRVRVRGVVCAAMLLLLAVKTVRAAEIDAYVGQPVVDVTLVSNGREVRDPSVLELVETEVGTALSMRHVRESLTHLFSLGTFEDVRVDASLLSGGVSLLYELVPLAVVERIVFDGDTGIPSGDLREEITSIHGATFDFDEVARVADTLRTFYRTRGFYEAQVRTAVEGRSDRTTLSVTVVAGSRAPVGQIFVTGIPSALYAETLNRLRLATGRPYDGREVERRLSEYELELRSERYYEAQLSHQVEIAAGGRSVDLRLDIRRGRRISISLDGDAVLGADLAELVPVEREGSVDEDLLEDADRRIEDHLNGLGYRDATVVHRREVRGDDLSIIFSVDPGPLYEVAEVAFRGNLAVSTNTLSGLVGLSTGRPLVMRELDDAVASVAGHYLRDGFATVRVEASLLEVAADPAAANGSVYVRCEIAIDEGVLTRVRSVTVDGVGPLAPSTIDDAVSARAGDPYFASQVVADRDAIRRRYLDHGFERVVVTIDPRFDENLEWVQLAYLVNEGPLIGVEHVLIVGNDAVDTTTIRREVTLQEGQPLSLLEVAETRRRLSALGLFRRIDIREFSHGGRGLRDVIIIVDEAPATSVGYGGGFEASVRLRRQSGIEGSQAVEQLEFAPRGFLQVGRRNLWGKNRSVDLFTRISLRRKNDALTQSDPQAEAVGNSFGFNEYRVLGTFQEPRVFGSGWDGYITGFVEQAIRPGFDLLSRGVNAQLTRQLGPSVTVSVDYGWGHNDTSNKALNPEDEPLVDRLFPQVRLSSFSSGIVRDTRDDPTDPRRGELLGIDAKVAARAIGSEVGFVKTFMQAFVYREVPGLPRLVAVVGTRVGLARAFARSVDVFPRLPPDLDGDVIPSSIAIQVDDLPLSERFFSGGDTTVRGFALDRLGDAATIDQDGFPQGGNATLIVNGELRARVTSAIDVVGFLDGGNVYDRVANMSLTRIRGGVGFGVRYRSPLGPIRVDLGFKLDRQTFENGEPERPTALHISLGQAF